MLAASIDLKVSRLRKGLQTYAKQSSDVDKWYSDFGHPLKNGAKALWIWCDIESCD